MQLKSGQPPLVPVQMLLSSVHMAFFSANAKPVSMSPPLQAESTPVKATTRLSELSCRPCLSYVPPASTVYVGGPERRLHSPKDHGSQQPEKSGFTPCRTHEGFTFKKIHAAVSAMTGKREHQADARLPQFTVNVKKRRHQTRARLPQLPMVSISSENGATDPRQTSLLCKSPQGCHQKNGTPPQGIQDGVRGCQAPDPFTYLLFEVSASLSPSPATVSTQPSRSCRREASSDHVASSSRHKMPLPHISEGHNGVREMLEFDIYICIYMYIRLSSHHQPIDLLHQI